MNANEQANNKLKEDSLRNHLALIKGIPKTPILVIEFVTPSSISPFTARNAVWGGIALVPCSNAPERASRSVLRSDSNVIELGSYKKGEHDILKKLYSEDGYIRHNGTLIRISQSKTDYVAALCRELGLHRAMLHLHNFQLISAMEQLGLRVHESLRTYQKLGKKSVFNLALDEFSNRHPDSTIGRFGKNFYNLDEIAIEVARLAEFGVRACVKFDESAQGEMLNSGLGIFFIPDYRNFDSKEKFRKYLIEQLERRNARATDVTGVVQLYVPDSTILSISSGQTADNDYSIYEAHTQTQYHYLQTNDEVITSDGGRPLGNDQYTVELLDIIWPQLKQLYVENGVEGDQNMNFIILPPDLHQLAKRIYANDRLSPVVPIDLNPRPISGTKRIMGRFSEETHMPINWKNFAARSLHTDPFFAANPHLIYERAASLGLYAGGGGNMSLTNLGTLIPEKIRASANTIMIKAFIQNTADPTTSLTRLEEIISNSPTESYKRAFETVRPEDIPEPDTDEEYKFWLEAQLNGVLTSNRPSA